MECSCRNCHELSRSYNNLPVRELDNQLSVDAEEGLIAIGMSMPREVSGHDAHSNFVVVDVPERHVCVGFADRLAEHPGINELRHTILSFGHRA